MGTQAGWSRGTMASSVLLSLLVFACGGNGGEDSAGNGGSTPQGTFTATGSMTAPRAAHTALFLPDGRVFIIGGFGPCFLPNPLGNCNDPLRGDLYDLSSGTFTATVDMIADTATLLPTGQILLTKFNSVAAQLYDLATGALSATGSMASVRVHTATLLQSGKVLIVGGTTAELYDPATGTFSATGGPTTSRGTHTATLLQSGKVLVVGVLGATADLYDPTTGTFSVSGSMHTARYLHTATLLLNGKVLIAGGVVTTATGPYLASAELYDPSTGAFSPTGNMTTPRFFHAAALLQNGKVLISGGTSSNDVGGRQKSTELYDPATGAFTGLGDMTVLRESHTATVLASGKVLIAGGQSNLAPTTSAEVFALN